MAHCCLSKLRRCLCKGSGREETEEERERFLNENVIVFFPPLIGQSWMHSELYWNFDSEPGNKHLGGFSVRPKRISIVGQRNFLGLKLEDTKTIKVINSGRRSLISPLDPQRESR